jgi:hypothetical protein
MRRLHLGHSLETKQNLSDGGDQVTSMVHGLVNVLLELNLLSRLGGPEVLEVLTSTVVSQNVRSVSINVRQNTNRGERNKVLLKLGGGDGGGGEVRVRLGLQRQVVRKQTCNMRRGHGGTGEGGNSLLGANVGGENVETRAKDVDTLSVVGEVGSSIGEGRGTNGDGILSGSRGVVASIGIVVTSSNGKVNASLDSSVDGKIKGRRLATTKRHIGGRTLESLGVLLDLLGVRLGGKLDTSNNVGHGSGTVRSKDLDGDDVGLLGNTVLGATNSTRTVGSVTVSILVGIARGNSLTPLGSASEVVVSDIDTGVNNVRGHSLSSNVIVEVLVERAQVKGLSVGDSGKTPGSIELSGKLVGMDDRVLLNVGNVLVSSEQLNGVGVESTGVTLEVGSDGEGLLETGLSLGQEGVLEISLGERGNLLGVDLLNPQLVRGGGGCIDILLEDDDVRVGDLLLVVHDERSNLGFVLVGNDNLLELGGLVVVGGVGLDVVGKKGVEGLKGINVLGDQQGLGQSGHGHGRDDGVEFHDGCCDEIGGVVMLLKSSDAEAAAGCVKWRKW